MTPPRWDSRYADRVRADLVHLVETDDAEPERRPRRRAGVDRPRLILTGAVAVLVAVVAVLAIRAGAEQPVHPAAPPTSRPAPTATASTSAEDAARLQRAVYARLPAGARTAPGLTWTDAAEGARGDGFETDGRTLLLAAACEGGGALRITISHRPDRIVDCSRPSTVGPIDVSAAEGADAPMGIEFDVRVDAGSPHYFATTVAIDDATAERFLQRTGS